MWVKGLTVIRIYQIFVFPWGWIATCLVILSVFNVVPFLNLYLKSCNTLYASSTFTSCLIFSLPAGIFHKNMNCVTKLTLGGSPLNLNWSLQVQGLTFSSSHSDWCSNPSIQSWSVNQRLARPTCYTKTFNSWICHLYPAVLWKSIH